VVTCDTIAAIASAAGPAARMIVRLSGSRAGEIGAQLCTPVLPAAGALRCRVAFDALEFPAWAYCFTAPRSYSGQDMVEIHLPGNPLLARMLLECMIKLGARQAQAGEFTARAYFNGRIDLSEAEGIAAVIAAQNDQELRAARQLMAGELARRLRPTLDSLADALALVEAGIDFSDEDVTFLTPGQMAQRIAWARAQLAELVAGSASLERLAHEPRVVMVGRPNSGKSTLLNALCGRDRAVVSSVPGTTRDVIWADVPLLRGLIRLVDAAGLESAPPSVAQDAAGHISRQMRQHALREVEAADIVLLVMESGSEPPELPRQPDLAVLTKSDLHAPDQRPRNLPCDSLSISALTGHGLDLLKRKLDDLAFRVASATAVLALNSRHVQAISEACDALARAAGQPTAGLEIIALELRQAIDALGRVLGCVSPDDLLGRIFATFCIGK